MLSCCIFNRTLKSILEIWSHFQLLFDRNHMLRPCLRMRPLLIPPSPLPKLTVTLDQTREVNLEHAGAGVFLCLRLLLSIDHFFELDSIVST